MADFVVARVEGEPGVLLLEVRGHAACVRPISVAVARKLAADLLRLADEVDRQAMPRVVRYGDRITPDGAG